MKKIFFLIIKLVAINFAFSQNNISYEFIGALTTTDQRIISYKLFFDELIDGTIEGVSTTDFYGSNITKSKIAGVIKQNELTFNEVNNISTKYSEDINDFCYVQVKNLKIRSSNDKKIINGKFIGKYASGQVCANGTIYLVSNNDVKSMIETLDLNKDSLKAIYNRKNDNLTLKNKSKLSYTLAEEKIVFDVWDGNEEDNDIINIYFNGKLIEKNLVIKNLKKTIEIPFNGKKGTIRIQAVNEGNAIPNTVNFILRSGTNNKSFLSYLKEGEAFIIEFNRN